MKFLKFALKRIWIDGEVFWQTLFTTLVMLTIVLIALISKEVAMFIMGAGVVLIAILTLIAFVALPFQTFRYIRSLIREWRNRNV